MVSPIQSERPEGNRLEKLKVSANGRFLEFANGQPFIWIADTCWTLPQRVKWDDVDYYMNKRKAQGFTVLQMVALDPEQDKEMRNPVGNRALCYQDLNQPNEAYFRYLDDILDKAEQYGFYVLLLPAWGELVVGHNWMGEFSDKIVNESNAHAFGRWIGDRYKDRNHILWCLGGDRMPVHLGEDYRPVWRAMAEGLAKGVLGYDLKAQQTDPRWQKLLMTYHACYEVETGLCSTMSYWSEEEAWISFIMLQSGHGTNVKNYQLVAEAYGLENTKPVFDGEPAYEMMPTTWPVVTEFHGDWMVRKRAYWSLFSGSFGHTYGHSSVWCMISEKERDAVRRYSWYEALGQPGAEQIKYLRDLLESVDLSCCVPAQECLLQQSASLEDILDTHKQACVGIDGTLALVYFPSGGEERFHTGRLKPGNWNLWWFCPRTGHCMSEEDSRITAPARMFSKPSDGSSTGDWHIKTPTHGEENDWVCVLQHISHEMSLPGLSRVYGEARQEETLKKVFEW